MSAKRTTRHKTSRRVGGQDREKGLVRMTLEEARAAIARGESRTDWARVDAMTEAEVEANAASDLDNPPWTPEMLARAEVVEPAKQAVSIRLDRDVLDFFKREGGRGYQSRINAALRAYVEAKRKAG